MASARCDPLPIPARWDDVDPVWMTAALAARHPGVEDDGRVHEVDLVEEYRRTLEVDEANRPSVADAWLRYRATPAHGLPLWLLTLLSDVHRHEVSLTLARRYAAAFVELDTPGALDALGA